MLGKLSNVLLYCAFITMILVVLPGIPPYRPFKAFKLTRPRKMDDKLAQSFVLDKAIPLEGQFIGAESMVLDGDVLYTAVASGEVLKIEDGAEGVRVNVVGRTAEPCGNNDIACTRPAGMRFDSKGNLVVVEAYEGIVIIDPKSGSRNTLISMSDPIDGIATKIPNDLDIARDGTIYWSDFTSNYQAHDLSVTTFMGDNSGRLIKYDPKTKKNTVLISGLFGANGVQLSDNEEYVLVNECLKSRTLKYYLTGPKGGTFEVFIDGLPGLPDNIRSNGRGGYIIPLVFGRSPLIDYLAPLPQLRKLLFRLQWFALTALSMVERIRILDKDRITDLKAYVDNFGTLGFDYFGGSVIEVDENGEIQAWYRTNSSEMFSVTQMTIGKTHAYFNSVRDDRIWKIDLADLKR